MLVDIPKTIESYARTRIVWFGAGNTPISVRSNNDGVSINPSTDSDVVSSVQSSLLLQRTNALAQLRSLLSVQEDGNELATGGESDVDSWSWNKDTQSPAGVISISLFPRKDYFNLIKPEDVLLVFAKKDKFTPEVFVALISVDSVREAKSVSSAGATVTRTSIQGRDLGKILMETPTVYDSAFGGRVIATFFSQFVKAFSEGAAQGGPSLVVQTMLALFFSMRQNFVTKAVGATLPDDSDQASLTVSPLRPWRFPGHREISMFSFLDTMSFVQTPMVGSLLVNATLLQSAANLWGLCDMYSNRIVNEFFIDTRDLTPDYDLSLKRAAYFTKQFMAAQGIEDTQTDRSSELTRTMQLIPELFKDTEDRDELLNDVTASDFSLNAAAAEGNGSVVALVHRQLPYDTFSFYLLPTSIVYETEIFESSLERSSQDVCNMFRIRFPGLVEGVVQDKQFGVTINRPSIEQHGIRRYEGESIYVFTNERVSGTQNFISSYVPTFDYYMSLVTTWYAYNERLFSGQISMRFRPDIRVGTRLTLVQTINGSIRVSDYYVQRVSHSFGGQAGSSRTSVDVVRGIVRADGLRVGTSPEAHLFWSNEGRYLDPDPMETVISEDAFAILSSDTVAATDPQLGDP